MRRSLLLIVFAALLTGCPGGGDGGSTSNSPANTPAATSAPTMVSGSVQAPNGQIAFKPSDGFLKKVANLFSSEVFASFAGLAPVADGTTVQLIRLDPTGTSFSVLSTATTRGGQYSFNFTDLNLQPSYDLATRVANGGVQMRAFVTGSKIDIDPASEAAVRLVLDLVTVTPGATLNQLTLSELRDIAGGLSQLATVNNVAAGMNLESTVIALKNAAIADPGMTVFLAAAIAPGQATTGTGDIGNYLPLENGRTWSFQGAHSEPGQSLVNFSNSLVVQGTKFIGGVATTVVLETNPLNSHVAEENYYLKDAGGVLFYGSSDADDKLTPKLVPYRDIVFPFNTAFTAEVVNKKDVDYGQDLDSDGRNELANVLYEVTVEKFETVTVPKGTFINAAKVNQKATLTVFSSAGFGSVTVTGTQTTWFAPGIGPVKRQIVIASDHGAETLTEELVDVSTAGNPLQPLSMATNDIIYDPYTQKIYASIPGNPGTVVPIDPVTKTVGTAILVGSGPRKLAISDNGQYLYVGLDGEGAVQRVDLLSQTAGPKFSLGSDVFNGQRYAEDIEVLPGDPTAVAISRYYKSVTPRHAGVAIYDNGIQRLNTTQVHTGSNVIEFSQSGTTLYGYNNETTEFGFRRLAVDASGLTEVENFTSFMGDLISGFGVDITFNGGFIYTTTGRVIDPVARTIVGTFSLPVPFGHLVRPDVSVGRVFFLTERTKLRAFDRVTLQQLASIDLPNLSAEEPSSLIRWGAHGLAFRTSGNKVFIVDSQVLIP